jgi:hypothetical protein
LGQNHYGIEPLSKLSKSTILLSANLSSIESTQHGESKMLAKIALAAALSVATFGVALASNENDGGNETGGYRELGPGGVVTNGVNPAYHRSLRAHVSKARTAGSNSAYGYAPTK